MHRGTLIYSSLTSLHSEKHGSPPSLTPNSFTLKLRRTKLIITEEHRSATRPLPSLTPNSSTVSVTGLHSSIPSVRSHSSTQKLRRRKARIIEKELTAVLYSVTHLTALIPSSTPALTSRRSSMPPLRHSLPTPRR